MSLIKNKSGIQLELRKEMELRDKAISGDMILVVSPAALGSSAAAVTAAIAGSGFTRDVVIELQAANGDVHSWFDGTFTIAIAEVTAGTGTASIVSTTATFENGRCTITITYIGTWAAADTATLTITGGTKLGYTIANKTSVDTLIA